MEAQECIQELKSFEIIKKEIRCSLCNKLLAKKVVNTGETIFLFGKSIEEGKPEFIPVYMEIIGTVKMRCIRKRCRRENPEHWNEF